MQLPYDDTAIFVHVVDAGSFSSAARTLAIPKSTISRTIARLEGKLGMTLIQRSTRAMHLTADGEHYYAQCAAPIAALADAAQSAAQAQSKPRGTVRLHAPPDIGSEVLPHIVAEFTAQHPEVTVETLITADAPSVSGTLFDLALYGGPLPDSTLVIRKLQDSRFNLYAAPRYLARHGAPETLAQLSAHRCVLLNARRGRATWSLMHGRSTATVEVSGTVSANDMSFVRRATLSGAGIALMPDVMAQRYVASGALATVLPNYSAKGAPLYILMPNRSFLPPAVAVMRDTLLAWFSKPVGASDLPSLP